MDTIIHCSLTINASPSQVFSMFTKNSNIVKWLAQAADVEPFVGGKYELFWDRQHPELNSTLGCAITAIETNKLLCFEWKGPLQFAHIMNGKHPLTHVCVALIPIGSGATELHLVHTGWGNGREWEEARVWFGSVWENALDKLADIKAQIKDENSH